MTYAPDDTALDAQAAAGDLSLIFAFDVTTAVAVCDGCGREGPFAELRLYGGGMGAVIRCPGCDAILLRVVTTPRGTWLDMHGLRRLAF
jgi:Family of unknown function (DUF6510)